MTRHVCDAHPVAVDILQSPFDGIIGFSQGANVACMYVILGRRKPFPSPENLFVDADGLLL